MAQSMIVETEPSGKILQFPLVTRASTPNVPKLALTPARKAAPVPAESGTCLSVLYVWAQG